MAATVHAARTLTHAHRLAQVAIGTRVAAQLMLAWPLLTPDDLDASFPAWLAVTAPLIQAANAQSAQLAATYLTGFRTLEQPDAEPFDPVQHAGVDSEQLRISQLVTGPIAVKQRLAAGIDLDKALAMSRQGAAAAGMRLALDGGRDTVTDTIRADPAAVAWERVASGDCCSWCQMLVDRGAVYHSAETAGDGDQWHDHCACTAEPVYR